MDDRSIATRKGMRTDYGIKMVKIFLEKCKKYGTFYILKLDISKYFYSIDHEVLMSLVKDKLTKEEYDFLKIIIGSTNEDYVNKVIKSIKENYTKKHPELKKEMMPYLIIKKEKVFLLVI